MNYCDCLLVVRNADESEEVELDLSDTPEAGRAMKLGMAVAEMFDASGGGDLTVTVSRYIR